MIRREPRVGERYCCDRVEVAERNEVPGVVDDHVVGHRAFVAEPGWCDPEFGRTTAVVLEPT
ncbi:hypothetical protein A8M60_11710 [Nocardia farcinica]|nr:hypothetical protein A8M60_11710 [Nocardia farcinica]